MQLLKDLSNLVTQRETLPILSLFHENIQYDDTIYGLIEGKAGLRDFFDSWWRDGLDYRWIFSNIVQQYELAYASFKFSYTMKSTRLNDPAISVGGMCRLRLRENLVVEYTEVINTGEALHQMGLDSRLVKRQLARMANLPRLKL